MICYANKLFFKISYTMCLCCLLYRRPFVNYNWQFKVTFDVIYSKTSARKFSIKTILCITYHAVSIKRNCIIQIELKFNSMTAITMLLKHYIKIKKI